MSLLVEYSYFFVQWSYIQPWFAAIFVGFAMSIGMLILFRHYSSLGGVGILASFFVVSLPILLLSILGAIALNIVISTNHKPERYKIT